MVKGTLGYNLKLTGSSKSVLLAKKKIFINLNKNKK